MATIRKGKTINISQEIIGKITILDNIQNTFSVICNNLTQTVFLLTESTRTSINDNGKALILNNVEYSKLNENDLIRISPSGKYEILYSIKSNDNLLFITEKCNSRCIFCPQPPKNVDDFEYYFNVNNSILDNLDKTVEYIGITGGEPLLAKEYLFKLLDKINNKLPHTEVQLLTNGKLLGNKEYFSEISNYITDKYIFGIPLYSDFENDHDNLVGCRNSYINTLKGLYNLASIGARIELRIVLNKVTISRLKQISEFIFKNLTFVEHVAFMGLEITGLANKNLNKIWSNNTEYKSVLKDSILYLSNWGIQCSIYNIPLCCLPEEIWEFSANSISDWKQSYNEECLECKVKSHCGGVFSTSKKNIYTIKAVVEK